jgi:hypothetical protein
MDAPIQSINPLLQVIRRERRPAEIAPLFADPIVTSRQAIEPPQVQPPVENIEALGPRLWRDLFLEIRTVEQLEEWEEKLPPFCSCRTFYFAWKQDNPPTLSDGGLSFEWKHALKSAVNRKLGQADLSLEAAREFWRSQKVT